MGNASEHFRLQLAPQVPWEERGRVSSRRKERKGGDAPNEMEISFYKNASARKFCPKEQLEKKNRILSLHFGGSFLSGW